MYLLQKKYAPKGAYWKIQKRFFFSHPDSTVGSGITPDHANARGLYRRYGISPNPEVNMNFFIITTLVVLLND